MAEEKKVSMTYRYLGNSGLKVSVLSLGTMLTNYYEEDNEGWLKSAKAAYEAGVNYFDSAEIYGMGDGDRLLGRAIKEFGWERKSLVIAVKLLYSGPGPNDSFMSRKHIIEGCKASLERIGIEYCDLVFSHRPDYVTPLEETCRAFSWLIDKGYANYWCTSTWPNTMITEAIGICEELGLHKPIADQCQYNMLAREECENQFTRLFDHFGYGTTVWSPLAGGLLSGKYNDGEIPEDSRFGRSEAFKGLAWGTFMAADKIEERKRVFAELASVAEELGCTQAELALAWVLVNRDVSTCIFGATKVSQVESNIKALEVASRWTPEIEERINKALGNEPARGISWITRKPLPGRRTEKVTYEFKVGGVDKADKI